MRMLLSRMALCAVLLVPVAAFAGPKWNAIGGDPGTHVTGDGDPLDADGADVRIETTGKGGAITSLDAQALRGHEIELIARLTVLDGDGKAKLWLRSDGAQNALTFVNGDGSPVSQGEGEQGRTLKLYVPMAATTVRLGAMLDQPGRLAVQGLQLRVLPDGPSTHSAAEVLQAMLDLAQEHALQAPRVDWPALRARVLTAELASAPSGEAYWRFREIAKALADRHSSVQPPALAADYREHARPTGAVHSWARDGVGYVSVPGLRGTDAADGKRFSDELCRAVASVRPQATRGWIVDLRGNDGGNMWPMLSGVAPLLGTRQPGRTVDRGNRSSPWIVDRLPACGKDIESSSVAVLIGGTTASSGEAVAVAFRGRPVTRFFGTRTAGLSTANRIFPLPDGGSLVLTTGAFVDRAGTMYPAGLEPDEATAAGEATVEAALDWIRAQSG